MQNMTQLHCQWQSTVHAACPLLLMADLTQSHGLLKWVSEWVHNKVIRGEVGGSKWPEGWIRPISSSFVKQRVWFMWPLLPCDWCCDKYTKAASEFHANVRFWMPLTYIKCIIHPLPRSSFLCVIHSWLGLGSEKWPHLGSGFMLVTYPDFIFSHKKSDMQNIQVAIYLNK